MDALVEIDKQNKERYFEIMNRLLNEAKSVNDMSTIQAIKNLLNKYEVLVE